MLRLAESRACLQRGGVTETMESARRWRGLVCPDCRFVFRVPTDHEGNGVVCPSCRRLLRIPGADDESPPLVVAVEEAENGELAVSRGERRRRRKRKKIAEDTPWEEESGQQSPVRQRSLRMGWQLAAGVVILSGLVVWLSITMERQPETGLPTAVPAVSEVVVTEEAPEVPGLWYDKEAVEELCRVFLAASSVEELLPLIRDPDRLEPGIRRHHPDGSLERQELVGVGVVRESTLGDWRVVTLLVRTKSHQSKFLNVCETADGLRVDWESWVGHSPMPWGEMMEKKPTEPVLVRVLLSYVDYYNMEFSNDQEWSSCRLLSPDGQVLLYGYVRRGSEKQERLFRLLSGNPAGENRASLMVRYPEGASSSNQVIVERVVADSWLIPEIKP